MQKHEKLSLSDFYIILNLSDCASVLGIDIYDLVKINNQKLRNY